ncbi:MAG: SEC-C metal-binding domain-containing protein [Bacilli bacterium]|nr:SEC-C metal-binding domain-containing protein [Bacilli bacterium]
MKRPKSTQIKSDKISRNDKCPCKIGKKYKHCCGK